MDVDARLESLERLFGKNINDTQKILSLLEKIDETHKVLPGRIDAVHENAVVQISRLTGRVEKIESRICNIENRFKDMDSKTVERFGVISEAIADFRLELLNEIRNSRRS